MHLEANARCKLKPLRGANWSPQLQNPLFFFGSGRNVWHWSHCEVQIEALSCKTLFFIGSGRNVWHWRPPQRRSTNGLLGLARPCCFPVSRPGFWKAFSVLSLGFAGCDAQTCPNATQDASRSQCEVQIEATARCKLKPSAAKHSFFLVLERTFDTEATARCKLKPSAAKPSFFIGSGRNVWHWRPPQRRSKHCLLGLARPCRFPVSRPGFWEAFSVLSPGFGGCDAQTCPNATQGAPRSQCEVQIEAKLKPSAAKPAFFWFWTSRLTLKPLRGANWSPQLQNPLFL